MAVKLTPEQKAQLTAVKEIAKQTAKAAKYATVALHKTQKAQVKAVNIAIKAEEALIKLEAKFGLPPRA
jgi:hypothetical protein